MDDSELVPKGVNMGRFELSWKTLTEAEPRLLDLYHEITAVKDDGTEPAFCANDLWYGDNGFKDRMSDLVGWETEEAYSLAYDMLYDLLPECRNCGCLDVRAAKER